MTVNPKKRQFAVEYVKDFNGTQAALRCGQTQESAGNFAYRMLMDEETMELVEDKIQERLAVADLSINWVLRQWKELSEANPNDLCYVRVECCRHCYGKGHEYQWTEFEYQDAVKRANAHSCTTKCDQPCVKRIPPMPTGGFGFTPRKPPTPECPLCHGDGYSRTMVKDTQNLKGASRRLIAGVKQTKDGIEIKMRDQDAALANISKYFGMLIDRKEISAPGGGPLQVNVMAEDLTDEQLDEYIAQERAKRAAL